jgi:hypothetical protein
MFDVIDIGIPMYLIMIAGYKLIKKSKRVSPATADLVTGKARIGMFPSYSMHLTI